MNDVALVSPFPSKGFRLPLRPDQTPGRLKMRGDICRVAFDTLTEEQITKAECSFADLVKILTRASAHVSAEPGSGFDMDDAEVARDVMMTMLEALVLFRVGTH